MKYEIQRTTQFKKDYKLSVKRGLNIDKLKSIIVKLSSGESLPIENKDHNLINSRNYKNMRECHIEPDWLLVYKISEDIMLISLERTGTHSDLFK
ncbi:MAG: type II toxin-antitoxin system YafQ family toxin [bacterium]